MSARVLLVNPPPHQRVDQFDQPDFTRLALACVAGELEAHGLGPVEIVDAKFERLDDGGVLDRVRRFRPDVVALTAMTNEILPAARVADLVKQLSPGIATVIGGVHVSVLPEETLVEFPVFDHGVLDDGEVTFRELVETLARGGDAGAVPGLVTRERGQPRRTAKRPRTMDLDSLAQPAWHLLPAAPRYLVSTQRGCPLHCPFCVNPNGRRVRQRSVERVVEELREITGRFGAGQVVVCDELFTLDAERTHRLLDGMIAAGLPAKLRWTACTHARFLDRDLLAKMKAAGCVLCEVGIETGDPDVMSKMGKAVTLERVRAVRRDAAEVGLPFGALMILGHPGETWESARRTIDFAVELNAEQTLFGIMVPYPGTKVAEMARRGENGYRLIAEDWNDYGKQHGHALELEGLSRARLELLQSLGYVKVLAANGRFADLARFLWKFRREGWAVARKFLLGGGTRRGRKFRRAPRPHREPRTQGDSGGQKLAT